jgi:hypothetical protein
VFGIDLLESLRHLPPRLCRERREGYGESAASGLPSLPGQLAVLPYRRTPGSAPTWRQAPSDCGRSGDTGRGHSGTLGPGERGAGALGRCPGWRVRGVTRRRLASVRKQGISPVSLHRGKDCLLPPFVRDPLAPLRNKWVRPPVRPQQPDARKRE